MPAATDGGVHDADRQIKSLDRKTVAPWLVSYVEGRAALDRGELADARRKLELAASNVDSRSALASEVHLFLAGCCNRLQDRGSEIDAYRKALQSNPKSTHLQQCGNGHAITSDVPRTFRRVPSRSRKAAGWVREKQGIAAG